MDLRTALATGAGRAVSLVERRVLGRPASQLPGRVALALQPRAAALLSAKVRRGSIVVCGTNGKTTTTNILASAIEAMGLTVLCNREGANMLPGVTSALLPGSSCDWAVMEADELSTIHVVPALRPKYLVLVNLFRDQLDRAGEIDHVQDTIVAALAASPETVLLACGDDPLCMGVARRAQVAGTRVLTFGIAEDLGLPAERVAEARFCQVCGAPLVYDYRAYAQLGAFRCPACGFARPELDYAATGVQVTREGVSFLASAPGRGEPARIAASFGGAYMVYNLLAAFAATSLAGAGPATFQHALDGYHPENGRLQRFAVGGREVILNLAKNPTGFNQNIALLLADERPKAAFVVVNDEVNDGHDVSWIWDMDLERLAAEEGLRMLAGGLRAHDVQVRAKYAGIEAPLAANVTDALAQIADLPSEVPLYVLCNYSALWPAKAELEGMGERS